MPIGHRVLVARRPLAARAIARRSRGPDTATSAAVLAHAVGEKAASDRRARGRRATGCTRSRSPRVRCAASRARIEDAGRGVGNVAPASCRSRAVHWVARRRFAVLADPRAATTWRGEFDQSADGTAGFVRGANGQRARGRALDRRPARTARRRARHQSAAAVVSRDGEVIAGSGNDARGRVAVRWTAANRVERSATSTAGSWRASPSSSRPTAGRSWQRRAC